MKRSYLVAALFAAFTLNSNLQAAIVNINIGPTGFNIGGINAGLASDSGATINDFPRSGSSVNIYTFSSFKGMVGGPGLVFAAGTTPVNFSLNASIDSSSSYRSDQQSAFRYPGVVSPDFGAGSYMGFKTSQNNYGWLEVTWNSTSRDFEILSGAYETTPNLAITAGAVPEPSTYALLLMTGAGWLLWKRRKGSL